MKATATHRFSLRWHSVRTRLTLFNVGVLAILLVSLGILIEISVRSTLINTVQRDLYAKSEHDMPRHPPPPAQRPPNGPFSPEDQPLQGRPGPPQGGRPDVGPEPADPPPPQNDLGANRDNPYPEDNQSTDKLQLVLRPRVIGPNGHVWPPRQSEAPWDTTAFRTALSGKSLYTTEQIAGDPIYVFSRPVFQDGRIIAVYQAAYPLKEIDQALAGMNRALLTLIPAVLLLAGFGGAFLADRALLPVRQLSRTTERIGAKDLSQRLPITGEDEFANLSSTFNGMLARLEEAFVKMEALVAEKEHLIEQQRRFTADASHELRTPLTIIKANTSLNLSGAPSEEDYRQSMEDIDRAASTMSRLVLDLLLLARADEEQLGRNRINFPLSELLYGAADALQRPGAALITVHLDEALEVYGNPGEISRVISNLLENAMRYTPAEGQILVTAHRDAMSTIIQVADTGCGISPEHLPHLCERFYRADAARTRADGGTGLGLAICRSIIQSHGGTFTIQSELNKGTTITISL